MSNGAAPSTARRHWRAITVGIALAVIGGAGLVFRQRLTVSKVEASIQKAGVVQGMPAERVAAVLDSLGAEHSPPRDSVMFANFGRSFTELFVHGDVAGEFRFDRERRLTSYAVREVLTGM